MEYVVCDTTVVSDLRRGGQGCTEMSLLPTAVKVVSVVTVAELRAGAGHGVPSGSVRTRRKRSLRSESLKNYDNIMGLELREEDDGDESGL
jgi:predicted nucleic acid-binding protein